MLNTNTNPELLNTINLVKQTKERKIAHKTTIGCQITTTISAFTTSSSGKIYSLTAGQFNFAASLIT